jgi:phosphopantothenoylcysteine synthetase/decarboxylase
MHKSRVIVTCGPAYEPIDEVRRITNMSTGRLGILLANDLFQAGYEVICLKGEGSSCVDPFNGPQVISFTTNTDLARKLQSIPDRPGIQAVFHAAALCDFQIGSVLDANGVSINSKKIPSSTEGIHLVLRAAPKLLPELSGWFPQATVVGWKYEAEGSRKEAIAKATEQLDRGASHACVLNGPAFGPGFAFFEKKSSEISIPSYPELTNYLCKWLNSRLLETPTQPAKKT